MFNSSKTHQRYNFHNGFYHIELKLKTISQLFDERDPAPFREKDLDDDAVDYIVTSLQELPKNSKSQIAIFVPQAEQQMFKPENIQQAIHDFFIYEAELNRRKLRKILEVGIKSLVIGLCFLVLAVFVSHSITVSSQSMKGHFIKEGLTLLGWVSMWKPVNIFLYDWWPMIEVKRLNKKLTNIEVHFKYY